MRSQVLEHVLGEPLLQLLLLPVLQHDLGAVEGLVHATHRHLWKGIDARAEVREPLVDELGWCLACIKACLLTDAP